MVRVLMLGWEFPPHISGGLGTACQGICEGLAAAGVDVLFVVPRAFGDEEAGRTRVVGANQVELGPEARPEAAVARERAGSTAGARSEPTPAAAALRAPAAVAAVAQVRALGAPPESGIVVESLLRPYLDPQEYARELEARGIDRPEAERLAHAGPSWAGGLSPAPFQRDTGGWRAWTHAVATEAAARRAPLARTRFEFSGGYGSDLFEEVARYARVVAHLAAAERFDVVHAHDWMTAPAALAAARATGRPLVMHAHALERDRSGEHPDARVRAIERLGLVDADRVVCVSHYTAGIVHHDYGVPRARIRVVHNAVTQQDQRSEWHVDRTVTDPVVLFLGRVTMQKGPEYFLEAAAQVVRIRPDVTFVLSGSGDMLARMVEYSARLGLARHVHFTGFLRGDDVERMYASADLYVMPSVSEPFGIAPLEAMALDVPVILSRQSGVAEVVTHALKVDFWDTRELANKILAVLTYAPLREDLIDSGREEVRRMRWEARGALLLAVYKELLR